MDRDASTRQRLSRYVRQEWRMLLASLLLFVCGAAAEPILPALFKHLLDSGFQGGLKYPLWLVPLVVIGLFALRGALNFAGAYAMNSATSRMVMTLREDLMHRLLHASSSLFAHMTPGNIVTRVVNEPQTVSQKVGGAVVSFIRDSATLAFLGAYLLYLNWELTLIALASMSLLGLTVKKVQRRLRKVGKAHYDAKMRLVSAVENNARAWRVVRTFDAVNFEMTRFRRESNLFRQLTMKQVAASSLVTPITQVVAAVGVSIILTLALWQASRGEATVGEFVSFITALLMTISPMRHLTDLVPTLNGALISAQGSFELLDAPIEHDTGTGTLLTCEGHIQFCDVSLRYDDAQQPALEHLSLDIRPGSTVALVGSSGAGKSTVTSALLRFVEPQEGQILLDGRPIRQLKLGDLRRQFAVVSQDTVLFAGSVAENVAYADPDGVDDDKVEQSLRSANLWDFVQTLPQGPATPIGNNGSQLSGGQRQRLAIARALYRDAAIWIFDEATSALDSESEAVVQRSIEDLRGSKTLILIAHRLSTIRNADTIFVMSEGQVVEQGNHAQLMAQGGLYAGMVRIQSGA
ncbi:MAG: lipid A export permease/ATP-binding protein MsbA [Rubrivivax sp.]|nr:MAG: lipid A export permease/ATP-binding protein MsbA [Rubrivivax sp.]